MKTCNRCKTEKDDSGFRVRKENRRGCKCTYLNNICKECERQERKEWYEAVKDDPGFKKINRDRAKQYSAENRDKVLEYGRERRKTTEWKEYMQNWYSDPENAERTKVLSRDRNRKYVRKNMAEINDAYVITQLSHPRNGKVDRETLKGNYDLIELMRIHIQLKRFINGTKNNPINEGAAFRLAPGVQRVKGRNITG